MREYIVLMFAAFIGMFFIGPIGAGIAVLIWMLVKYMPKH